MKKKTKPVRVKDLKPAKGAKGGRITNTRANANGVPIGGATGSPPVLAS